MKRLCVFLLALALCVTVCACSKTAKAGWQEQYDLGLRYLSEGKYEEAVLAFTAAIEIDPKQPDAYIGLADAYVALGDTEAALEALQRGLAAVGDSPALSEKLAALEDTGGTGGLEEEPVNEYGGTSFRYRESYIDFDTMSGEQQAVVTAAVSAAMDQDPEALGRTLEPAMQAFGGGTEGYFSASLCTFRDGYKISLYFREEGRGADSDYLPNTVTHMVTAECRPENGTGFSLVFNDEIPTAAGAYDVTSYELAVGTCAKWQWSGEVTYTHGSGGTDPHDGVPRQVDTYETGTGQMKDNLRDGLFTMDSRGTFGDDAWDSTYTLLYQDGRLLERDGAPEEKDGFAVLNGAVYSEEEMEDWMRDNLFW